MNNSMAEGSQTFEEAIAQPGRPHQPRGRPDPCRLAHQPDVAPAEPQRRARQGGCRPPADGPGRGAHLHRDHADAPLSQPLLSPACPATLQLAEQLISASSVTPEDAGCQQILGERLAKLGFSLETIESGPESFRVTNLLGRAAPCRFQAKSGCSARPACASSYRNIADTAPATRTLVFAGHTDVVPTGPLDQWTSHPSRPRTARPPAATGRGACDMKTSLAAFVVAIEEFLAANPDPAITLALLLTSDEEGPASTARSSSATPWRQGAKCSTASSASRPPSSAAAT